MTEKTSMQLLFFKYIQLFSPLSGVMTTLVVKAFFPFVFLMDRGPSPAAISTFVFLCSTVYLFSSLIMNYPFIMQEHLKQAYEN